MREQLFSGRPAVGETVQIGGVHFTVVGVMARKIQLSNYFSSDDDSVWIPYSCRRRPVEYKVRRGDGLRADRAPVREESHGPGAGCDRDPAAIFSY